MNHINLKYIFLITFILTIQACAKGASETSNKTSQLPNLKIDSLNIQVVKNENGSNNIYFDYIVTNDGKTTAKDFSVQLWSHLTTIPEMGQIGEMSVIHTNLLPAHSLIGKGMINSTLSTGIAYAIIDDQNAVKESNEDDNITEAHTWEAPAQQPNLTIAIDTVTAARNATNNEVTITYTVSNISGGESGPFAVDLWSGAELGNNSVGEEIIPHTNLLPYASIKNSVTLLTPYGTGLAHVTVDKTNKVFESNESDNDSVAASNWQLPPLPEVLPDLSITIDKLEVVRGSPAHNVIISYTVSNNGAGDSGAFNVDLWSHSAVAPLIGTTGDQQMIHSNLPAGSSVSRSTSLSNALDSGIAYVIVDSANQIAETNENNNLGGGSSWLVPPLPANLTITIDNVTAVRDIAGDTITIDYTVLNNGERDSGPFSVDLWANLATPPVIGNSGEKAILHNNLTAKSAVTRSVKLITTLSLGNANVVVDSNDQVSESNENDNIAVTKSWQLPPLPANLTIKIDNISAIAGTNGNDVTIQYTVMNTGGTASGPYAVDLWSNSTSIPVMGSIGEKTILQSGSIAPAGSHTNSTTLPNVLNSGIAYVIVDSANIVIEGNESDNIGGGSSWQAPVVNPPANLSITIDSVIATATASGADTTITYTVTNSGVDPSGSFTVDLWANSGVIPAIGTTGDISVNHSSLLSATSLTNTITVPTSVTSGTAYTIVDSLNTVIESNETDNISTAKTWQIPPTSAPADLSITIDSMVATGSTTGNSIDITYTVKNLGTETSASFNVDLWSNLAISPTMGDLGELTATLAGLAGNGSVTQTISLPTTLASGLAYAIVDTTNAIIESNESNNSASGSWQVPVSNPPTNLTISIDSVNAIGGVTGNELSITYTISNVGATPSGAFQVDVWSNAASIPTMGSIGEQTVNHASLIGAASLTNTITLLTNNTSGIAYAIVDSPNVVTESNETDNIGGGSSWQVPVTNPPPNLSVSIDSITAVAANIDNDISITYTVTNNGVDPSGPFAIDLWSNTSPAPIIGSTGESTIAHTGLIGAQSTTLVSVIKSPLTSGVAYAIVDSANVVAESNETDNVSSGSSWTVSVPILPDLNITIDSVTAQANAAGTSDVNVTYTVTNNDVAASGSFAVDLWSNSAVAPVVGSIGEQSIAHASLVSGGTITQTITMKNLAASGTAYVVVDTANVVKESIEINNVSSGATWIATPLNAYTFEDGLIPTAFYNSTFKNGDWWIDKTTSGSSLPGSISLASPPLAINLVACIELTATNMRTITFDFQTDISNLDYLTFYVDEANPDGTNYLARWSGVTPWRSWTTTVATIPGNHVFTWCYWRQWGKSAADTVWLDNVILE